MSVSYFLILDTKSDWEKLGNTLMIMARVGHRKPEDIEKLIEEKLAYCLEAYWASCVK